MKYQALIELVTTGTLDFEAPENATKEELEDLVTRLYGNEAEDLSEEMKITEIIESESAKIRYPN